MLGGGLGNFAPGEWSDDTAMAIVIAEAIAKGDDPNDEPVLDRIAEGFVRWIRSSPPDVGIQTSAVLSQVASRLAAGETGAARIASEEALVYSLSHGHSAGNGALMRTAPLALAHLHERERLATAARRVAQLTHADPLAGDACVLWCEAVRIAVVEARIDATAGLDLLTSRTEQWADWISEATHGDDREGPVPGSRFKPNGYTVTALQAAVAAITNTQDVPNQFEEGLHAAIRIGDDTDTVAAIAGSLLGARWGTKCIPEAWRTAVHGWPGHDHSALLALCPWPDR